MKKKKLGFTLIELMATLIIIVVVLAIAVPLVSNLIEIVRREAFRATAYSIVDSGRFMLANKNASDQEFYYRDGVQYNADNKMLDYSGKGPETGTVILNTKGSTVAIAIHNGTYCATKSANERKVTINKTTPDNCNAYTIINTCDTWEEIALKYDVTLDALLKLNNETDSNSSTCGRDIKIPVPSNSTDTEIAGDSGSLVYYKTYYTVGYVGYSNPYPGTNYEYTIQLGVLPLPAKDIKTVRVIYHNVFEELDDFKRYIVKKNMREVIWPGEEPKQIDINQASVFKDHAATSNNMTSDDVTVQCNNETCYATVGATVNNLNNVNPNTIDGYPIAYTPIKFTVEFNGEAELCTVRTVRDTNPGVLAGTGTSADPYLVESVEDLVALSKNVSSGNTYSGKTISLTNTFDFKNQKSYSNYNTTTFGDINGDGNIESLMTELTTGAGFIPIGNGTTKFSGKILGNSNCIFNLYINRPTLVYTGFIGYSNGGNITALNLNDIDVTGNNYTGGLVGYNNGNITDSVINGTLNGGNYVGMATGYSDYGHLVDSIIANGDIKGSDYVAGIVGSSYYSTVRGVNEGGTITSTGTNVGRVVGKSTSSTLSSLALSSTTINGSPVTSSSSTALNGQDITKVDELNNINLAETALDTYIGGDNDGNGYYWDYNVYGKVVHKDVVKNPLTFNLPGSGTSANPYLISDYDDLKQATLKLDKVYKLTSNIDLLNKKFYMIGSYSNPFTGTFNGDEKAINNLKLNSVHASYAGFAGYNKGSLTAINLNNIDIDANNFIGGLAGYSYNGGITEGHITGDITGNNYVGKAVGYFYNYDSSSRVTSIIVEGNVDGNDYVGGAIGYAYTCSLSSGYIGAVNKGGHVTSNGSNISRIVGNTGAVSGSKAFMIGGLAISSTTLNGSTITSNYSTSINGQDITSLDELNNINLAETSLDTYIGGDDDNNGYYWDYDSSNKVVLKNISDNPLTFSLAGSGTSTDPYLINSYSDLRQASMKLDKTYKLTSNIDLNGKNFYMLGSYMNRFRGMVNGNEKTISNLTIDAPHASYIGFTGYNNNGTISALSLNNVNINSNNYTGGLVGYTYNGYIIEDSVTGNITGDNFTGMALGYLYNDYSTPRLSSIIVSGNLAGSDYVGGLVGYAYSGSLTAGFITGINEGGTITSTTSNVGRSVGATGAVGGGEPFVISSLALNTTRVNGSTIANTYPTTNNGADFDNLNDLNNINLVELALDTYIGGDDDGNGYYWDYDNTGKVVRRYVSDYPLTFTLAGSGTTASPYLISTYSDLRQSVLKLNVVYKLTNNIDLSGQRFYEIGSYVNKFTGTINGNLNTISNLTIDSPHASYVGFVGYNKGTIDVLNLNNLNINASNYTGGLAGYIYNGKVIESTMSGNVTGNNYVGLAAGYIYNYYSNARLSSIMTQGNIIGVNYVGGLVGYTNSFSLSYGYIGGIYKGGNVIATGTNVGRTVGATYYCCGAVPFIMSSLAMSSATVNGVTINDTYNTSNNGSNISSMSDVTSNINLAELALDTYIGGDDDGNGYYWDYNESGVLVLKNINAYPLTFGLSGSGTTAAPYLVGSYDDLRQASLKVGSVYKLTSDIDLSGKNFYELGSYVNKFTGTIIGSAKTISNLSIDSPHASYAGLIGYNKGTINGLYLTNANINASNYAGGIIGYDYNGNATDLVVSGNIDGNNNVGLVAGYVYNYYGTPKITSVVVSGDVNGNNAVGGLIGASSSFTLSNGYIKGVYAGGSLASSGTQIARIVSSADYCCGSTTYIKKGYVVSSVTVNGSTGSSSDPNSLSGATITSSDLSSQTTYTNADFNFTDETLDYIWYIDGGTAKFREGSL